MKRTILTTVPWSVRIAMSKASLIISYSASSDSGLMYQWITLEQIVPLEITTYASLKDLHEMWISAATGKSAKHIRSATCPVEFDGETIRVFLGFYVWPSSLSLPFTLSSAMGEIGPQRAVRLWKEFSIFADNRSQIDLPYYMENVAVIWESPTFDRFGTEIPHPTFEIVEGNAVKFSSEVFGAFRVAGTARGYSYDVTMELSKPVEEIEPPDDYTIYPKDVIIWGVPPAKTIFNAPKIENLENTITATWTDREETESEQLRLTIPKCVEALLEMCPDMYKTITLLCNKISTQQVYYNACTGEVMYVVDGVNPQKFCTPISGRVVANPWGPGIL